MHGIKSEFIRKEPVAGGRDQVSGAARALHARGDLEKAVGLYRRAIKNGTGGAETMALLAAALERLGRAGEALEWYRQAVALEPVQGKFWLSGAILLARQGALQQALEWFGRACNTPRFRLLACYNMARVLKQMGRLQQAEAAIRYYLKEVSSDGDAWNILGTIMMARFDWNSAEQAFSRAVDLAPGSSAALVNLALVMRRTGRFSKALGLVCRAGREKAPCRGGLPLQVQLRQQMFHWQRLEQLLGRLEQETARDLARGLRPAQPPFLHFTWSMDSAANLAIARAWARKKAAVIRAAAGFKVFRHERKTKSRITIAYLSGQFFDAATGHLTRSMFRWHDRKRFRIICYSLRKCDSNPYTSGIKAGIDSWVDLDGMDDITAARRIYGDSVDILVDMTGHMEGNRLGICALRPAPIQVHYLGYPATTGADFIDYQIVDPIVVPERLQGCFSEKLIYLPCYQVCDDSPPVSGAFTRCAQGLPPSGVVFCSFNSEYKLDPLIFAAWLQILKQTPDSVLWLLVRQQAGRKLLRGLAREHGVAPQRLVFARPLPKSEHLGRLKLADLALDTRLVNGHTTTSDALLMGLPVITLKGLHFASRVSASLLVSAGLDQLVARSLEDYVRLAVELARNKDRLEAARAKLKGGAFCTRKTVAWLEKAYIKIWRRHLEGQKPQSFRA